MGDCGTASAPSAPAAAAPSSELSCTICLAPGFNTECRVNGCSHSFCFACISEWVCQSIRPSCPMCRKEIDQVLYGFEKEGGGRMKIYILEYRSLYSTLSMTDRSQLIGERRVIVRNMMHAHKTIGNIKTALSEQAPGNEQLNELLTMISQHVEKSEVLLENLRTEAVRKNHSLVFANPSFRKMIYTVQIRVKYADYGRTSETRADLARDPERLRKTVSDFLMAEFDAIPLFSQPKTNGISWRTKFLGSTVTAEEKVKFAENIYDLMLTSHTGNASFQTELLNLLPQIGPDNVQLLDDHLEALVAVNQPDLDDFYNAVYYDSVFNNSAGGIMDLGFSANMRDERADRFEIIFRHMQRDAGFLDWELGEPRLRRQTSNTNGTDRATNNDDSSRSASPEERVPTPMPGDEPPAPNSSLLRRIMDPSMDPLADEVRDLARIYQAQTEEDRDRRREEYQRNRMNRYRDRAERERQLDEMFNDSRRVISANTTSRTIPFLEAHQTALRITREMAALRSQTQEHRIRSLRPTARREEVLEAARQAEQQAQQAAQRDPPRNVPRRDNLNERVRQFEQRSIGMSNILRSIRDPTQRIGIRIPFGVQTSNSLIPVYMPERGVIEAIPRPIPVPTTSTISEPAPTAPPAPGAPGAPEERTGLDERALRELERDAAAAALPPPPDVFPLSSLRRLLMPRSAAAGAAGPADEQFVAYLRRAFEPPPSTAATAQAAPLSEPAPEASQDAPSTSEPEPVAEAQAAEEPTPELQTPSVAHRTRAARRAATTGTGAAPATKRRRGN